jgi:MFS transporter, DHA3 family, tetracycline resistance protein
VRGVPRLRSTDPARLYLTYAAVSGFAFQIAATATSIFLIVDVGVEPLQLVLVGTVLEITVTTCELPTGILADTVSRRLSIIVGLAVMGVGFLLYAVESYPVILVAQVIWGLGFTFTSGADVAWITDEIGEENARPLYARSAQVEHLFSFAGLVLGAALATVALWLPIATGGVLFLVAAVWLAMRMPENGFVRPERDPATGRRRVHHQVSDTVREARATVRRHPGVLLVLGVIFLAGFASEGFDRLWQLHLVDVVGVPGSLELIVWIAIVHGAGLLAAIAVIGGVRQFGDLEREGRAELAMGVLVGGWSVGVLVFALSGSFVVAAIAAVLVRAFSETQSPVSQAWLNRDLDPRTRATVNSLASQSHAIGEVGGGPVFGGIAQLVTVPVALVTASIVQAPAIVRLLGRRRLQVAPATAAGAAR